jgi:hypothetical protein
MYMIYFLFAGADSGGAVQRAAGDEAGQPGDAEDGGEQPQGFHHAGLPPSLLPYYLRGTISCLPSPATLSAILSPAFITLPSATLAPQAEREDEWRGKARAPTGRVEKQRKALAELEAQLVLASPHLLFQVTGGTSP